MTAAPAPISAGGQNAPRQRGTTLPDGCLPSTVRLRVAAELADDNELGCTCADPLAAVWNTGVVPMLEVATQSMRLESARIHHPKIITIADTLSTKRP